MKEVVVIVGAGPSGLATSASLTYLSIPNIILEKEDCCASLWKKRSYDRLHLHLAKDFCSLPHMPHLSTTPTFMPKDMFVNYIDTYVSQFKINVHFCRSVESSSYNVNEKKWRVEAKNTQSGELEVYIGEFLVVATGENNQGFIPELPGLKSFPGEIVHSSNYKSGLRYQGKEVLVVGSGNSGMEISYDLSNYGLQPSIVIKSPLHVLTREMVYGGMLLQKYLPVKIVDSIVILFAKFIYGNLSKYGIRRPRKGPFTIKAEIGRSPVIDVGTIKKIRAGEIKVVPQIVKINGSDVVFGNGDQKRFDVIVFATGYKRVTTAWLKDYHYIVKGDGLPKNSFPSHWKGENGAYCVGLSGRGLFGVSADAKAVADDIFKVLNGRKNEAAPLVLPTI